MAKPVKVIGYGRMSMATQEMSPQVQEHQVKAWYDYQVACNQWPDGSKWMGFLCDEATHSSIPLLERPKGELIPVILDPGDFLVVAKHDRAFRSGADTEITLEKLTLAGIKMVMLNLNIDTSTHDGVMMATIFGAASRWERENIRRRTKETLQLKKSRGEPYTLAPSGWKNAVCGRTKKKILVPNIQARKIGDYCKREFLAGKSSWRVIDTLVDYKIAGHKSIPTNSTHIIYLACLSLVGWPKKSKPVCKEFYGPDFGTLAWFHANAHFYTDKIEEDSKKATT